MTSFEIAMLIAAAVFFGAVLGMVLNYFLPSHHTSAETKSVISVSMAVLGTMSALVIGFLVSNANASFRAQNLEVSRQSSNIVRLDRLLERYGQEASPPRQALARYTALKVKAMFPDEAGIGREIANADTVNALESVQELVFSLKPNDERQRWFVGQAQSLLGDMNESNWIVTSKNVSAIPLPFLALVVFWLTLLFASFGLFAPRNTTTVVVLLLSSIAVSGAIKVILDMDSPFGGNVHLAGYPIRISGEPILRAMEAIRH